MLSIRSFLKDAFPCRGRYAATGILYGVTLVGCALYRAVVQETDEGTLTYLVLLWPMLLSDWRLNLHAYMGWAAAGILSAAAVWQCTGWAADGFFSPWGMALAGGLMLAVQFWRTVRLRQQGRPAVQDPIQAAVDASWEALQAEEERRVREITDENARHKR